MGQLQNRIILRTAISACHGTKIGGSGGSVDRNFRRSSSVQSFGSVGILKDMPETGIMSMVVCTRKRDRFSCEGSPQCACKPPECCQHDVSLSPVLQSSYAWAASSSEPCRCSFCASVMYS